jgi:hypothetical protein
MVSHNFYKWTVKHLLFVAAVLAIYGLVMIVWVITKWGAILFGAAVLLLPPALAVLEYRIDGIQILRVPPVFRALTLAKWLIVTLLTHITARHLLNLLSGGLH